MDKFVIEGGTRLSGTVTVSGAKNAVLPILAASLLCEGETELVGVPHLRDVDTMCSILTELGTRVERDGDTLRVQVEQEKEITARYELVSSMRASVCVLGPLVAKRGRARVSLPGGCVIGVRPIDLHIRGLKALGAKIKIEHGFIVAQADVLEGTEMYLGGTFGSTVTGTANVLCAAVLARGKTVIENAACEPELQTLARFLQRAGACIKGIGTHRLEIEGVRRLTGVRFEIIPDRIEAGTFMIAAAMTGGQVKLNNCVPAHLGAVIDQLRRVGAQVERADGGLEVRGPEQLSPTHITTLPYPGFPTDLQAQMVALLCRAPGISVVSERIFPDRFLHVAELNRMGANIHKESATAVIHGVERLYGAPVMASDLRASAALVLAGLVAQGTTEVSRIYHLDRGYEKMEQKLSRLGAKIKRMLDKRLRVVRE